ncbi:MAG: hypothetical protein ABIK64_00400 [Bacillota bacterium]
MNWLQKRKTQKRRKRTILAGRGDHKNPANPGKASGWAELDRQIALSSRIMRQGIK